jgi:hypothetical protein
MVRQKICRVAQKAKDLFSENLRQGVGCAVRGCSDWRIEVLAGEREKYFKLTFREVSD